MVPESDSSHVVTSASGQHRRKNRPSERDESESDTRESAQSDQSEDDSDNDSDEDAKHEDETPQERARRNWKKARKVLELVTSQRSAGLISAASAAGLNDIKDAAVDAKNVLTLMRRGLSAGKTQFKIAVGLFQVLGEMPTVLNLRYPPIFRIGFLGKLS